MSDWTSGYVADIGYTYGYYTELNPLKAILPLLNAGIALPTVGAACELGFGQGLSINMHAAASNTQWAGTDFNPSQAGFAQELGTVTGAGARMFDEAFAEFAARTDLPDFDYIGLHGIWSWISDDNRAVIVDFVRRKLKVGGLLYISYNTLPGWATFAPMRHLLTQHAQTLAAPGAGVVNRIDQALAFTDKLLASNPAYTRVNTHVAERLGKVKEQNRHYLAHEYFNKDWHPMYFSTMADWLGPAKLGFACSASYVDHIDALNLSDEQQALLKEIPDAVFRESVRDFMVNQQFRKDYWIKGARKLTPLEQAEAQRQVRVLLVSPRADVSLKVNGVQGEANMSEAIYGPILDLLADHKPRSLGQIEQGIKDKGVSFPQLFQSVMVLAATGHLVPVQDEALANKLRKQTDRLNGHLAHKARSSNEIAYAASPVAGGGHMITRFGLLFVQALALGKKAPADLAAHVWVYMQAQGQKIVKDGKALEAEADNLAEITVQATAFLDKQLPILKALQIV